jgi:hypothetical protein
LRTRPKNSPVSSRLYMLSKTERQQPLLL